MKQIEGDLRVFKSDQEIHIFKTGFTDAYHGVDQTASIRDPKVLELYLEGRVAFSIEFEDAP